MKQKISHAGKMPVRRMLQSLFTLLIVFPGMFASASESSWPMDPMEPDLENLPSLQNGWRLYTNYCLGCHSLKYQRYERTADDLAVPHDIVLEQLIFTGQKIGEPMTTSMDPQLARNWFGAAPPDLTLVARLRGVDWLYNYLRTFYLDESRPLGVNNKVFPNVGMPNVLLGLQGVQVANCQPAETQTCDELVLQEGTGAYTSEEFDAAVYDLVNFLYYTGDPSRLERHRIGVYVLLFLVILFMFTWLLGREYQKDVKH